MIQKPLKQSVLLIGLIFLFGCATLPNHDADRAASKKSSIPQPSTQAPLEGPRSKPSTATLQETVRNDTQTTQSSASESVDSNSPAGLEADPLSSLNEPAAPADIAADGSQDSQANDSTREAGNSSVSDPDEEATYDVPIVRNESVEDYIEYFQTEIRDKFTLWLERSGRYIPLMRRIFKEHGLPEDLVFVALIESGFNPYAYSHARAVGAWQFIKGTGRLYGLRVDNWIDERRDPIKSTEAAARYLKDLYERFGSWPLAMAGYNAGEGKIGRALIKAKTDDFWDLVSTRHIRRETKGYVPKFMAATIIAKNPERYGFTLDYNEPLRYDTVIVAGSADLRVVAQTAGVPYEEIKALNPELRTELTPPTMEKYSLKLPFGTQQTFTEAYSQIPDERKIIGTRYSIRRNDTLATISRRFGTSVSLLREINHLPQKSPLREGEMLFIPKLQSVPAEPKSRVVASVTHSSPKTASASKKPPVLMASIEKRELGGSADDTKKILYRVKDGDTLWDISKSFNVSIQDLKRYNGMGKRSRIRPGDQLVLGFESKDL
jgi:membrane-bound lytic murein transglycosylase D